MSILLPLKIFTNFPLPKIIFGLFSFFMLSTVCIQRGDLTLSFCVFWTGEQPRKGTKVVKTKQEYEKKNKKNENDSTG